MLAVAQRGGRPVGAVGETDARERGARRLRATPSPARIAPEVERMPGMRLHRERDIVERAEIEEQRRDLERARQPEPAAPWAAAA